MISLRSKFLTLLRIYLAFVDERDLRFFLVAWSTSGRSSSSDVADFFPKQKSILYLKLMLSVYINDTKIPQVLFTFFFPWLLFWFHCCLYRNYIFTGTLKLPRNKYIRKVRLEDNDIGQSCKPYDWNIKISSCEIEYTFNLAQTIQKH